MNIPHHDLDAVEALGLSDLNFIGETFDEVFIDDMQREVTLIVIDHEALHHASSFAADVSRVQVHTCAFSQAASHC